MRSANATSLFADSRRQAAEPLRRVPGVANLALCQLERRGQVAREAVAACQLRFGGDSRRPQLLAQRDRRHRQAELEPFGRRAAVVAEGGSGLDGGRVRQVGQLRQQIRQACRPVRFVLQLSKSGKDGKGLRESHLPHCRLHDDAPRRASRHAADVDHEQAPLEAGGHRRGRLDREIRIRTQELHAESADDVGLGRAQARQHVQAVGNLGWHRQRRRDNRGIVPAGDAGESRIDLVASEQVRDQPIVDRDHPRGERVVIRPTELDQSMRGESAVRRAHFARCRERLGRLRQHFGQQAGRGEGAGRILLQHAVPASVGRVNDRERGEKQRVSFQRRERVLARELGETQRLAGRCGKTGVDCRPP
jgi:hypothetical protein